MSDSYGIVSSQLMRGYYLINSNRELHFQYISTATLLENQTATLLMEVDKMTGHYTGNPEDYTAGGMLVTHDDDGNEPGDHAIDFGLQAQCGANLTLYNQLELSENGLILTFFDNTSSEEGIQMYSEFKANLDEFKSRGFGILGINDSLPAVNMDFATSLNVDGREIIFFYDKNGKTGETYGVYTGWKTYNWGKHDIAYFIVDKGGVITFKHTGSVLENQTDILIDQMDKLIAP